MAERRMFAKTIIDSDAFLDMPLSTQSLYFHLSMRADDDGFVNNPKKIQRMIGCGDDDLKLLIAKSFLIPFDSGIVVIKHWKIHNYIQKDRYKPTVYHEEAEQLGIKDNKTYTLDNSGKKQLDTECIQDVSKLETQVRLGKDSLGESSLNNNNLLPGAETASGPEEEAFITLTLNDKSEYPVSYSKVEEYQELYPAVDVQQQLRNMKGWLNSNPTKRKTKSGINRFINSWLAREQDKGGSKVITVANTGQQSNKSSNRALQKLREMGEIK
ncbi:MAG: DNA replication protein [Lentihominibacter sp.]